MKQISELRRFDRWVLKAFVRTRLEAPRTQLDLDEEYWLALRYPAEIPEAGEAQLLSTDPGFAKLTEAQKRDRWREFRAYVRQAEGFYRGAAVLAWKSSPLNYYYSFMNLAKASVLALGRMPARDAENPRAFRHGLSARIAGTPGRWNLTVGRADDVFSLLYETAIGAPISEGAVLDARDLLAYVGPISWQLTRLRSPSVQRWWPGHWICLSQGEQIWDVIGIPRAADLSQILPALATLYEELTPEAAKLLARETLNLRAVGAKNYRFFQRSTPLASRDPGVLNTSEIEQSLLDALPHCLFQCLDSTQHEFCIGLPYPTAAGPLPMNELVASYAVMYFLSSLVRYHPDYMDTIGESTDAWLIESFAKSAPLSLLRHLAALTLGYSLVIERA